MKLKLIAIVLPLLGLVLLYSGFQDQRQLDALQAGGETVPGLIEGGEVRSGRRSGKTFKLDVSFTPKGGRKTQQTFTVSSDFAAKHVNDTSITDDRVEVRYLPGDLSNAMLVGDDKDPATMMLIGGLMVPAGLVLAFFLFRPKKPAAPAPAPAPTPAA